MMHVVQNTADSLLILIMKPKFKKTNKNIIIRFKRILQQLSINSVQVRKLKEDCRI